MAYKKRKQEVKFKSYYNSPIGTLTLISDGTYLTNLLLENSEFDEETIEENNLEIFLKTKNWLTDYFKGKEMNASDLPLKLDGTPFRKLVWNYLINIPYNTVKTYGNIAKEISLKMGKNPCAQAIGNAVGHNKIPIIIPCHRVVGNNKNLTGYTGGISIKMKLLNLEGINIDEYKLPKKGKLKNE